MEHESEEETEKAGESGVDFEADAGLNESVTLPVSDPPTYGAYLQAKSDVSPRTKSILRAHGDWDDEKEDDQRKTPDNSNENSSDHDSPPPTKKICMPAEEATDGPAAESQSPGRPKRIRQKPLRFTPPPPWSAFCENSGC